MNTIQISVETQQIINAELANSYGIVPKAEDENGITFFIDESMVFDTIEKELELILGRKVLLIESESDLVKKALLIYYRQGEAKPRGVNGAEKFEVNSQDFLEKLIHEAKSIGCSDIHLEVYRHECRVRYRIDGKLIIKYKIEGEDYLEIVNKIKIKSHIDITEKRLPQDGRISYDDFDIRVSILPTLYGEKIVMRILGRDSDHLNIDKLGMMPIEKERYLEALKSSKGIILLSGPTGSGKTTTLYSSLKLLNKPDINILTVEDPIEYTLKGINQVQLREDIGLSFNSTLRSFLRQDPDVIMLGEIRDKSTAEMAIRLSLTGHLVLSTIHTNSATGTISRLVDMGIPSFLIAETLIISVAQRLLRKLCNSCKIETNFVAEEFPLGMFADLNTHWKACGCEDCYFTGYKGRTAIYEIIPMDNQLGQKIKKNELDLEDYIAKRKYSRLSDQALDLVKTGSTSMEEVYSIIVESNR